MISDQNDIPETKGSFCTDMIVFLSPFEIYVKISLGFRFYKNWINLSGLIGL